MIFTKQLFYVTFNGCFKESFHLIGTYSSFISSFAGEFKKCYLFLPKLIEAHINQHDRNAINQSY